MIQCRMFDVFGDRNRNKNKIKGRVGKNWHHLAIMKVMHSNFNQRLCSLSRLNLVRNCGDSWSIWQDVETVLIMRRL